MADDTKPEEEMSPLLIDRYPKNVRKVFWVFSGSERGMFFRRIFVEFLGTLIFIFIGSMQSLSGGGVTVAALTHGITISVLIMSMGHISGGHFNPAVTLGVFLSGGITWKSAISYIVSQLTGGVCGTCLVRLALAAKLFNSISGGATIVPATTGWMEAIIVEAIMTFLLVNTVLLVAVDTNNNLLAPLAIGFSIMVDIFAGGNITGASMNPARSFGPAVGSSIFFHNYGQWPRHYVYWVGPIIGATLGSVSHRILARAHYERRLDYS